MACNDSNQNGIPQMESNILLSFLEDSQLECCDDERLKNVIQSLEAVIDPILMNGQSVMAEVEVDGYQLEEFLLSNEEQMLNQESCASSNDDLDFSWMDIEMSPSSPSDNISWYEQVEDNMGDYMIEYGVQDYLEIPMEEHMYSSLWQETYHFEGYQ